MPGILVCCQVSCDQVREVGEWRPQSEHVVDNARELIGGQVFFYDYEDDLVLGKARIEDVASHIIHLRTCRSIALQSISAL